METLDEVWTTTPWTWVGVGLLVAFAFYATMSKRFQRTARTVTIFVASGVVLIFIVVQFADPRERWGCVLALLPAVMIFQHAVFLRLVRMPFQGRATAVQGNGSGDHADDQHAMEQLKEIDNNLPLVFAAAQKNSERYFSPATLAVRYGTPAVAVAIVGIVVFYLLFVGRGNAPTAGVSAAQLGVAGAYVYVLLYLGQRNFRHDVTSGGAMWCAVTLAVGPIVAWSIDHIGGLPTTSKETTSSQLLYFASGLVPRHVAAFVEETIRRVWVSPTSATSAAPRTIPITQVRGITTAIGDRLAEEGITDLYALANADPLRLIRNTNYDKRQLLSWIDESILITVLPDQWQQLEKDGYTGAIDLAWMRNKPERLPALAKRLKIDDPDVLVSVIDRLYTDAQLRLVWVLYQLIDQIDAQNDVRQGQSA